MSDYVKIDGGEKAALAVHDYYYSQDLILPIDFRIQSSSLSDMSEDFSNDGTYQMWGSSPSNPDLSDNALSVLYDLGGIEWRGVGTIVVSAGEAACDPTSPFVYAGAFDPPYEGYGIQPFFALQAFPGIGSDDQYVQCEVSSVRSGQTVGSANDRSIVGLVARTTPNSTGGTFGSVAVLASFVQSGYFGTVAPTYEVPTPYLVVTIQEESWLKNGGLHISFRNASYIGDNVNWTGLGIPPASLYTEGGPTLAPGDVIRLEVVQTNFNVLVNGVSLLSGDLSKYGVGQLLPTGLFPGLPGTPVPGAGIPIANTLGGQSCGVYAIDDYNSGSGFLGIKNFSCGALGDQRAVGNNTQRNMPVAFIADMKTEVKQMDTQNSVQLSAGDTEAVVTPYTAGVFMQNSPIMGIASSCTIGNYGYFLAQPDPFGFNRLGRMYLMRYDPLFNTWTELAPPPIPTLGGSSPSPAVVRGQIATVDGLIYLVAVTPLTYTSSTSYSAESFTLVYDPEIDSWTSLTPMPHEVSAAYGDGVTTSVLDTQGVIVNGKYYCPGGYEWYGDASSFEPSYTSQRNAVYDIGSDTWADETPLPYARGGAGVVALGTDIYLIGGRQNNTHKSDTTIGKYDTVNQTWTLRSTRGEFSGSGGPGIGLQFDDAPCVALNGRFLEFSGSFAGTPIYISPEGEWSRTQSSVNPTLLYMDPRGGNTVTRIGHYFYGPFAGRGYRFTPTPFTGSEFGFVRMDPDKFPWVI